MFSGLLFGLIHVAGLGTAGEGSPEATTTFATVVLAIQAVLKVAQAGMFGFCMAALFLKTRSLALPVLTHALFNAFYFMPSYLAAGKVGITYLTGNCGDIAVLVLSVALLFLPCVKSLHMMTREVVPYYSFDE